MNKICKFYVKGNCKEKECKYIHKNNICRNYFFGECNTLECNRNHEYKLNKKKINTENYNPEYREHSMVVKIITSKIVQPKENDVFLTPNLFCDENDKFIYNKLLNEIKETGINDIFKLWHGDTHLIADDHVKWKKLCPTFNYIIETLESFYGIEIKASRFNWYKDSNDFKPYHFDAAAIDIKKAESQNMTIGVSFGATREIAFEHAEFNRIINNKKERCTVSFPLVNGMTYGFGKKINIEWRHGIPQIHPSNYSDEGRISIIVWGQI